METKTSVSSVSDTGLAVDAPVKTAFDASYTVEASFVMSFTLLFIAVLLLGVFDIHSRVAGSFLLQEAMEQAVFTEEETESFQQIAEMGQARAGRFFRCEGLTLQIEKKEGVLQGSAAADGVSADRNFIEIHLNEYKPEDTLRLQAAVWDRWRREEIGNSIQERDEP